MPQVILADKSDLFRRSMSSILNREGYEVIVSETGAQVLELAEAGRTQAVILDTEVEGPSGLEVLGALKANPRLRRVPVVVVSRNSAPLAVSSAFKLGAEGFLLKPVELNVLLKTLAGLRRPQPALNAPIAVTAGEARIVGKLRFIDQYNTVYLDKEKPDTLGPVGTKVEMIFPCEKDIYRQVMLVEEENEQGISLVPVGTATLEERAVVSAIGANMRVRYMYPGQFMRLAEAVELSAEGVRLKGVNIEPHFNSPVQLTLYPPAMGQDGQGIALQGKVSGYNAITENQFELDVALDAPQGLPFVQLMAALIGGRPMRSAPQEAS
ncbi:MAG TPA: response regulator [Oscillatoriaceae cyanobacterium]